MLSPLARALHLDGAPPATDWLDAAANSLIPVAESPRLSASCTLRCFGGQTRGDRECNTYGSWTLCEDVITASRRREPLVYSIGIGSNVAFDIAMVRAGARVRAWDPTINSTLTKRLTKRLTPEERARFTFLPVGLADTEGVLPFFSLHDKGGGSLAVGQRGAGGDGRAGTAHPASHKKGVQTHGLVARLPTLQLLAGDAGATIDVLKVDVEGAEWPIFAKRVPQWLRTRPPDQVAIELHERWRADGAALRAAVFRNLWQCGYAFRHNSTSGEEVLFVRVARPGPACAK